jgi:hypothetical protein
MHQAVEEDRVHELADLADTATDLIRAVLTTPADA